MEMRLRGLFKALPHRREAEIFSKVLLNLSERNMSDIEIVALGKRADI